MALKQRSADSLGEKLQEFYDGLDRDEQSVLTSLLAIPLSSSVRGKDATLELPDGTVLPSPSADDRVTVSVLNKKVPLLMSW